VANARAAISAFMIRLHVWTIVLDLCISAEADWSAPAVVRRLQTLDREKQCLFPGSLISDAILAEPHDPSDRSKQISSTLSIDMSSASGRLSELSRYDPAGLMRYLEGKENWLLTEFIELAPIQFIDELVCEMTSLEFGSAGIRPRST
jgi:hypothetical protein